MQSIERTSAVPRWVIWGEGELAPRAFFDEEVPDEHAFQTIEGVDAGWRDLPDAWAVVATATEDEIKRWAERSGTVRGYLPFERPGAPDERAKVEQPRPY